MAKMERWEYIKLFLFKNGYVRIYPIDKVDVTVFKLAFKNWSEFVVEKNNDSVLLFTRGEQSEHSIVMLILNILGENGWEAFSASDSDSDREYSSEHSQSIFLKRRIEK
jgi:hypothetical protein